jgi:stage V sporulation protein G
MELRDESGRNKLYADIAHPINSACREAIQECIVKAFEEELEKSKLPGYVSSYDDYNDSGEEGAGDFVPDAPHFSLANRNTTAVRKKKAEFGAGIFE